MNFGFGCGNVYIDNLRGENNMGRKIKLSENIGLQLKEFRTKYKVKGKDIAELLGKSSAYVSKLEKGQIHQIEKDELVKITNYITQSDEGYYLFCEKIAETADAKELNHNIWLINFDFFITNDQK